MKKKLLLTSFFVLLIIFLLNIKVDAATLDKTSVDIWARADVYSNIVTIPSNYLQKYTIKVNGANGTPTYKVTEGNYIIEVSSKGVVTPKKEEYTSGGNTYNRYNFGTAKVKVTVDGQNLELTVNLKDYTDIYCDNVLNEFVKNNINSSMTETEKLNAIAKYTAEEYDYSVEASGYKSMILTGGGDCWASTSMILKLCDMVGINAHSRNGNRDSGSGSGHMNAVAIADGSLYEIEAGYNEEKPRYYYVRKRSSPFTINTDYNNKTATIVQYDGFDENITVPSKIGEYTVTKIGDTCFNRSYVSPKSVTLPETITEIGVSAFYGCSNLESINIPKSVTNIEGAIFTHCKNLKTIKLNGNYIIENNILYNANKTKLIEVLYGNKSTSITIPSTVTEIASSAFYNNQNIEEVILPSKLTKIGDGAFYWTKITGITIPASCKEIGTGAFYNCTRLASVIIKEGVTTIGPRAFAYNYNLDAIQIPKTVTSIGDNVFYSDSNITIYGSKGTTAETYANENNITFVAGQIKTITENMITVDNLSYNGKTQYPKVTVKIGSTTLKKDTDYTLTYDSDLINAGNHTVVVKGKGNYTGEVTKKYSILAIDPQIEFTCGDEFVGDMLSPKVTKNPYKLEVEFFYRKVGDNYSTNQVPTDEGEYIIKAYLKNYNPNFISISLQKNVKIVKRDIPFTDVRRSSWYYSAVKYVYDNNIIKGINETIYAPNDKLTRSMMVTTLYRMAGSPNVSGTSTFEDVKDSSKWYYKAVVWASKNNIVSGYSNGNFGPNDNITREQLAVMLYKYAKYKGKNVSKLGDITKFTDYKNVASYAVAQVKWAVGAGVITGSNNKLNPKGNATRAEAASMIYKYCAKVGK